MENRNGLVDAYLTDANGYAERMAALHMIEPRADRPRPIMLGGDGLQPRCAICAARLSRPTPRSYRPPLIKRRISGQRTTGMK
jgi:hypothetical protein